MNWTTTIDINTFNDAYETWNTHFKRLNKNIDLKKFLQLARTGKYYTMSLTKFISYKPLNINLGRLKADTVKEAYADNPRGDNDVKSVKYHIKTTKPVSPVIAIIIGKQLIFLDGVHRVVACKFRKSPIRMLVIK